MHHKKKRIGQNIHGKVYILRNPLFYLSLLCFRGVLVKFGIGFGKTRTDGDGGQCHGDDYLFHSLLFSFLTAGGRQCRPAAAAPRAVRVFLRMIQVAIGSGPLINTL